MRVLNFGSLNFDRVYNVDYFVQAGETILSQKYEEFLGGKGLNQSLALARAGAEVFHMGAVGPDGDSLLACLQDNGVDVRYIRKTDVVSGHAVIQKSFGQNCIIVCGGSNQTVSKDYIDQVLQNFGADDLILVQNETSNVPHAIREAKKRGMKVAFNASPITPEVLHYPLELVDYYLINEVEGKALSGIDSDDFYEILEALAQKFPDSAIVLTVGEHGVLYRDKYQIASQGIYKVKVADTTAAGDTFCGFFLSGILNEQTVQEALCQASKASAIAVSKDGAAVSIPTMDQVRFFTAQREDN